MPDDIQKSARSCSIQGCGRLHFGRGWCRRHYARWYAHGDPMMKKSAANGEPMDWLANAIDNPPHDPNECQLWPFSIHRDGYGKVKWNGQDYPAHKVSLLIHDDRLLPPEDNPIALHAPHNVCGNRHCIRPSHLRWGSYAENQEDRVPDDTHHRGERQHLSKLTQSQVLEIFKDARKGVIIASDYGVSAAAISAIKTGKTWSWLTGGPK